MTKEHRSTFDLFKSATYGNNVDAFSSETSNSFYSVNNMLVYHIGDNSVSENVTDSYVVLIRDAWVSLATA